MHSLWSQNPTSKDFNFLLVPCSEECMYKFTHWTTICRPEAWKHIKNHLVAYLKGWSLWCVNYIPTIKKWLETVPVSIHRGWLNKCWYIHAMKYKATVNKNEEAPFSETKSSPGHMGKWKARERISACTCIKKHKGHVTNYSSGSLSGAEVGNN